MCMHHVAYRACPLIARCLCLRTHVAGATKCTLCQRGTYNNQTGEGATQSRSGCFFCFR